MKHPPRYGLTLAVGLTASLVFNVAFYLWFRTNTLATFRVSELIHSVNQTVNDNLPYNWSVRHHKKINAIFDRMIDETDLGMLLGYALFNWHYREDIKFWDVADLPVIAFTSLAGDCDDYARMAAYILHRKGFEQTYLVSMVAVKEGHLAVVYYDTNKKTLNLVDVNGSWVKDASAFDMERDIRRLLQRHYSDMVNFGVRTWDMKKVLLYAEVGG